jgi:hypothetical protein
MKRGTKGNSENQTVPEDDQNPTIKQAKAHLPFACSYPTANEYHRARLLAYRGFTAFPACHSAVSDR